MKFSKTILTAFLFSFVFVAFVAPTISKAETKLNKTDVNPNKDFTITFNTEMDETTFDEIFVEDARGDKVEVTVQKDGVEVMVDAPENGYEKGESYTLQVNTSVKSSKGIPLKEKVILNFTVSNEDKTTKIFTQDTLAVAKQGRLTSCELGELEETLTTVKERNPNVEVDHSLGAYAITHDHCNYVFSDAQTPSQQIMFQITIQPQKHNNVELLTPSEVRERLGEPDNEYTTANGEYSISYNYDDQETDFPKKIYIYFKDKNSPYKNIIYSH